jgi:hypothetical protein
MYAACAVSFDEQLCEHAGHEGPIKAVCFSAQQHGLIASCDENGRILVRSAVNGELIQNWKGRLFSLASNTPLPLRHPTMMHRPYTRCKFSVLRRRHRCVGQCLRRQDRLPVARNGRHAYPRVHRFPCSLQYLCRAAPCACACHLYCLLPRAHRRCLLGERISGRRRRCKRQPRQHSPHLGSGRVAHRFSFRFCVYSF